MVALLAMLLLQPGPGDSRFSAGVGFFGYAGADLETGAGTLGVDSIALFPSLSLKGDGYTLVSVFRTAPMDSLDRFKVVQAGGRVRLPGSPWIGAGAFHGADAPFVFGLEGPWLERDGGSRDSLVWCGLEAGGVLGFTGFYGVFRPGTGDSLVWAGVRSPWLGFAQLWWDGLRGSEEMNTLSGMVHLGVVTPWFSVCDSSGLRRADAEVRGYSPVRGLSTVPWVHYSGADSTTAGVKLLFSGSGTAQSGFLSVGHPVQERGSFAGALGYFMRSRAGIHWNAGAEYSGSENWSVSLRGGYPSVPGSFGAGVAVTRDSTRAGCSAGYAPVPGVSARLEMEADIFTDTPDPSGTVTLSGTRGWVTLLAGYTWSRDESTLSLELGGWLGP
jgi:hypothetical protein